MNTDVIIYVALFVVGLILISLFFDLFKKFILILVLVIGCVIFFYEMNLLSDEHVLGLKMILKHYLMLKHTAISIIKFIL